MVDILITLAEVIAVLIFVICLPALMYLIWHVGMWLVEAIFKAVGLYSKIFEVIDRIFK